jgi:hypothetical protein
VIRRPSQPPGPSDGPRWSAKVPKCIVVPISRVEHFLLQTTLRDSRESSHLRSLQDPLQSRPHFSIRKRPITFKPGCGGCSIHVDPTNSTSNIPLLGELVLSCASDHNIISSLKHCTGISRRPAQSRCQDSRFTRLIASWPLGSSLSLLYVGSKSFNSIHPLLQVKSLRARCSIRNRAARPAPLLTRHCGDLSPRSGMEASRDPSRYKYPEPALL